MKHLDLFSGIGGFALAARIVGGIETQQFVELDSYCQKVLAKNFPGIPIHDDIQTFTAKLGDFDLITFGSPCQDFSCANPNGRGLEGERSGLFFEAVRLLRLVRPKYAVFENVANVLTKDRGLQFQQILRAFYESGFDAEWQVISAASVGAPHLRERVFIVAYPYGKRCYNRRNSRNVRHLHSNINRESEKTSQEREQLLSLAGTMGEADANLESFGLTRLGNASNIQSSNRKIHPSNNTSQVNGGCNYWSTEPGILRVANGIPDRIHRIRGLGNAVVPQVAAIALRRVLELEAA